ncbi:MAK10-like protein [Tanacetum coccineum]
MLPAGSITHGEDLYYPDLLAQFFPPRRTAKLRNDIMENIYLKLGLVLRTYSKNGPHNTQYCMENPEQAFVDYASSLLPRIKRSGPHDTQYCIEDPEQAFVEYASLRTNEARGSSGSEIGAAVSNTVKNPKLGTHPVSFYNSYPSRTSNASSYLSTSINAIKEKIPAKMGDPGLFTLTCRLGDSKPFDTLADLGSCVNIIPLYLFKKLNIGLLEETDHVFGLADGTKSYPIGIVRDCRIEVHRGKTKLLNGFLRSRIKKESHRDSLLFRKGILAYSTPVFQIVGWPK